MGTQALILAAGRGSRLGEKSSGIPKCLLEVGRRPLVEHQLEALAEAGVGPVGMVIGYCADEIQEVVGYRAEYILNPRWNVTNSLYSFWLAREWVKGPLLILNSDILFHPGVLDRLLATKGDAVAYDSGSGQGREHMKVKVAGGRLVDMSKDLPPQEAAGENLGVLSLTAETAQALFRKAEALISGGGENHWLGAAVCALAHERDIRAVDVAGLPWGEIDFPFDLSRVRKEVWPAIHRDAWKRRVRWRHTRWVALLLLGLLVSHLAIRAWVTPPVMAWETVAIKSDQKVKVTCDDRTEEWWLLDGSQDAELQVTGPVQVHVESRVLLPKALTEEAPYVLEVKMDGKRIDWFKESGSPSSKWRHPEWAVAKCRRIKLEVPQGPHSLRVRLVASEAGRCLLRARQEDLDDDE